MVRWSQRAHGASSYSEISCAWPTVFPAARGGGEQVVLRSPPLILFSVPPQIISNHVMMHTRRMIATNTKAHCGVKSEAHCHGTVWPHSAAQAVRHHHHHQCMTCDHVTVVDTEACTCCGQHPSAYAVPSCCNGLQYIYNTQCQVHCGAGNASSPAQRLFVKSSYGGAPPATV